MNRILVINAERTVLSAYGKQYAVSCLVRTAANGLRALHDPDQVHYSMNVDGSRGKPVMPAVFPAGTWDTNLVKDNDPPTTDVGPVLIITSAHQMLHVWALDAKGGYDHETDEVIADWGYDLHFCDPARFGVYSVGCLHTASAADIEEIAAAVRQDIKDGNTVQWEAL